jgi:hypothetical protein
MSYPRLQLDPAIDTLGAMLRLALGLGIESLLFNAPLRPCVIGVGSPLVVLRLVHPEHLPVRVHQQ